MKFRFNVSVERDNKRVDEVRARWEKAGSLGREEAGVGGVTVGRLEHPNRPAGIQHQHTSFS